MTGSIQDKFFKMDKNQNQVSAPVEIEGNIAVIDVEGTLYSKGIELHFDKHWTPGDVTVTLQGDPEVLDIQDASGNSWRQEGNDWLYVIPQDTIQTALKQKQTVKIGFTVLWGDGKHNPEIRVTPLE